MYKCPVNKQPETMEKKTVKAYSIRRDIVVKVETKDVIKIIKYKHRLALFPKIL